MGLLPIQAVNMFRTQPINFREAQHAQFAQPQVQTQTNPFMSRAFSASNSPYNLEHPKVSGSETLAKKLDLIA